MTDPSSTPSYATKAVGARGGGADPATAGTGVTEPSGGAPIKIVRKASFFADENDPIHHPTPSPRQGQAQANVTGAQQQQHQANGGGAKPTGVVSYAAAARKSTSGSTTSGPSDMAQSSSSTSSGQRSQHGPASNYSASPISRPSFEDPSTAAPGAGADAFGGTAARRLSTEMAKAATSPHPPGQQRPPSAQRSHSHSSAASASRAAVGGGGGGNEDMAAGQGQGRSGMAPSLSQGLETMLERSAEEGEDGAGAGTSSTEQIYHPLHHHRQPPQTQSHYSQHASPFDQPQLSRHRSSSSSQGSTQPWGPALGAGSYQQQHHQQQRDSSAPPPNTRSLYQRSNSMVPPTTGRGGADYYSGLDSYGGRAFSPTSGAHARLSYDRYGAEEEEDGTTPFAGRSLNERTHDYSAAQQQQRNAFHNPPSNSSPFYSHFAAAANGAGGVGVGVTRGFGAGESGLGDGTESRRHSLAFGASPPAPNEPRRAIGFHVSGPANSSSHYASAPNTGSVGGSFGPGTGPGGRGATSSSALSVDDLASDLGSFMISERVPSSQAAMQGAHAASMPGGFSSAHSSLYGQSPSSSLSNHGPPPAPPISRGASFAAASAAWDSLGRDSTHHQQQSAAARSRFRAASVGPAAGVTTGHRSGQETPLARAPSQQRQQGGAGWGQSDRLSASYSSSSSAGMGPVGGSRLGPSGSTGSSALSGRRRADSNVSFDSSGREAYHQPTSPHLQAQYAHQPQQQMRTSESMLATLGLPQLSDLAMQSLATLGPLAPLQGGELESGGASSLQELGKGVPLHAMPGEMPLYIVEFKQGRTDLYFKQQWGGPDDFEVYKGDLVVVEADRGKDLGTVVNE